MFKLASYSARPFAALSKLSLRLQEPGSPHRVGLATTAAVAVFMPAFVSTELADIRSGRVNHFRLFSGLPGATAWITNSDHLRPKPPLTIAAYAP